MYLHVEHGKKFEADLRDAKESLKGKAEQIRAAVKRENKVINGNG